MNFYFISYNIPAEPSRIRVYVWRNLKKIGALNLQQSLWLIPEDEKVLVEIQKIKDAIESEGGTIYIVSGSFIYGSKDMAERFNNERDKEYKELLEYCMRFHEEMKHETETGNFTFAELEENEEEYDKINNWYEKINGRDYFNALRSKEVKLEIAKCKNEFDEFSARVYQFNNVE